MVRVERTALVAYSAEQMFDLVNDIEAYPQYMDGCVGAEVLVREHDYVEARLDLKKGGISQSFSTCNRLQPPHLMQMSLKEGPFSHFNGEWRFESLAAQACKVILVLEFEFAQKLVNLAAGKWFEHVASQQVDALCERAKSIYH